MKYIDMSLPSPFKHDIITHCIVTAFYDIGRKNWDADYQRSAELYLTSAKNYFNYDYPMVMFVDKRYYNEIKTAYEQSSFSNKHIIPITEKWLEENSFVWNQRNIDQRIIHSKHYKNHVQERIDGRYPETRIPYYNVITNCKVDFLTFAIEHYNYDFWCWSDFGYFNSIYQNKPERYPINSLDIKKMDTTKINMTVLKEISEQDGNVFYTLKHAPEVLATSMFAGPKHLILEFQILCHQALLEFHEIGITDDDQHVYLRPIIKKPDMFCLFIDRNKWPEALSYFQKDT